MKTTASTTLVAGLALGLLLAGCSSRPCRPCADPGAPPRTFLVLNAKPVPDPECGFMQVFVDGRVVSVSARERLLVLEESTRVRVETVPVWSAGTRVQDVSFGPQERELSLPKILAVDGQDATVYVGEYNEEGSVWSGWHLAITPTVRADEIHMTVSYGHHEAGRLIDVVPATSISGPADRTFIIESRPPPQP